eukprot:2303336-Rhodomonas_salina.1
MSTSAGRKSWQAWMFRPGRVKTRIAELFLRKRSSSVRQMRRAIHTILTRSAARKANESEKPNR